MKILKAILIPVICLSAFGCNDDGVTDFGQQAPITSIYGTVTHAVYGPISNAIVTVNMKKDTTTNDGYYRFDNILDSGVIISIDIDVTHPDFIAFDTTMLCSSESSPIDITLLKSIEEIKLVFEDAFVSDSLPFVNFGDSNCLSMFYNDTIENQMKGRARIYIKLPLPTYESKTYQSVHLYCNVIDVNRFDRLQIMADKITMDWTESLITWDNRPFEGGQPSKIGEIGDTITPSELDLLITKFYSDFEHAEYGIRLSFAEEEILNRHCMAAFASSEYADSILRPYVVIEYLF